MIRSFRSKLLELPWDGSLIGKAYPRVSPMVRVGDKVLVEEEEEGDVDACDVAIEDGQQGLNKFHSRLWSKLGLLQKRREDMLGEGDYGGGDVVNKPLAESWHKRGFCGFGLSAIEVFNHVKPLRSEKIDEVRTEWAKNFLQCKN
ncbi:hypothetical protein DEO72_LG4g1258 [Vigna unguiculata]|uniref:Uncharacterized protein n=1 Tax=Vigna unguiculata TaxID=3917 RepID=A0A4D6LPB1_VIGUN|nr:hypothetical protein DEO72_LG4g1258 [Vigna unguiculata]